MIPRVKCSAAGRFRARHMATDRQYHLTDPGGCLFVFCSACCLLEYAIYGALPADVEGVRVDTSTRSCAGGAA